MSDAPFNRSSDGEERGTTEGGDDVVVVVANGLIDLLIGKQLVQSRMGYGVHLELGYDHEVTIGTPFEIMDGDIRWAGEPLTAAAAGALLTLKPARGHLRSYCERWHARPRFRLRDGDGAARSYV